MRLRELGAQVAVVPAYETVAASPDPEVMRDAIAGGRIDAVTLTSSSTVRHFVQCLGQDFVRDRLDQIPVASIGPITSQTARDYALTVILEAKEYSIPGLIEALQQAFGGRDL
jgi:uroporphyrinogen III methyltransferase/synthase